MTLAFLGNAVFALAFGVSLIYLLQERYLKHKKITALMKRFPSLESLDRLNYQLLVWGFPLMTLGHTDGQSLGGDPLGPLLVLGARGKFPRGLRGFSTAQSYTAESPLA